MYYILVLIILLSHYLRQGQSNVKMDRAERISALIICTILVLMAAFRSDSVGADTNGYRMDYLSMGGYHSIQAIVDRYTSDYLVYFALSKLFHMLGLPVQVWFGVVEAFYLFALMKLINKFSKDKIFSLLVFTTIGLFSFSMAGLKQTMASSMMMLAFWGFIEKKYWLPIVLIPLTYYTHQSVLIFLAAFPLYYLRKSRLLILASIVLCILIYFNSFFFMEAMVDTLDNERWEKYLVTDSGYSYVTLIFYMVITFVASLNLKNYHSADPDFSYYFLGLSILGVGLQFLSSVSPSLFRLAYLYTPFLMILLPNTSYYSKNSMLVRAFFMASIIFYFLYTNRHWPYSFA